MTNKTETNITLYKIDRCGYFSHQNTDALFCSPSDLLHELKNWSINKNLAETALHSPNSSNEYDTPPVYLFDIQNKGDIWILSTWNEVPSNAAGVPSIEMFSKVGQASVHSNQIEADTIPGYPTYFCFFPKENIFGTICFKQRVNGQQGLKVYLKDFLTIKNNRYIQKKIVKTADGSNEEIRKYVNPNGKTPNAYIYPLYETTLYRKTGNEQFLLQNFQKINKIITRKTIEIPHSHTKNSPFFSILRILTGLQEKSLPNLHSQRFEAKFDIHFNSQNDLKNVIDSWHSQINDSYNDYGFKLTGESQKTHWLSNSMAKDKFIFDLILDENGIVSAEKLLEEVIRYKDKILNLKHEK